MGPARIGGAVTSWVIWSFALYVWKPTLVLAEAALDWLGGVENEEPDDDTSPAAKAPRASRTSDPHAAHIH